MRIQGRPFFKRPRNLRKFQVEERLSNVLRTKPGSPSPAPEGAELMIFAIFGGATVKVREEENIMFSGVSLFGGRSMEPKRDRHDRESDGDRFPLPLEVAAYSIFGGVSVKRG